MVMPGPDVDRTVDHDLGRVLGQRYRLEERIGVGASAVVYRATDLNLNRAVAVKQVKPELSGDARFIKLFRAEAHLAGQLDHPNVLTIHDWSADDGGADGGAYIVTEHLTGGTLRELLDREGPLPMDEAAMIGLQVARGLRAAHAAGLVHRDVKPGNILFGADGRIRIGDFGIARAVAEAAWTEPEGHLIGTARYAAPEQGMPGEVNGRADVYSLAVCLMEMITGEVPLVGESALATMVIRRDEDIPVDPGMGPVGDLIAWAGLAEWAGRPTADQIVEELSTLYGIQAPEPVADVDLTNSFPISGVEGAGGWPTGSGAGGVDRTGAGGTSILADQSTNDLLVDHTDDGFQGPGGSIEPYPEPIPGRGRLVAIGLFLVAVVAAVAGGWLLAGTERGETEIIEVGLPSWEVPDFQGMTAEEARSAIDPGRWTVGITEQHADGTRAGELLEQRPLPGVIQGPGATVELVYSLGPEPRLVPELVGLTQADARLVLGRARLTVGVVSDASSEEVDAGLVLEATIAGTAAVPGTEYPTGTAIDLVVSSGPAPRVVPDVRAMITEEARLALDGVDLLMAVEEEYSEEVAEGRVIGLRPAPGTEVERGSTVTVVVSLGLPLVVIPDLAGQPVLDAAAALTDLGFEVRIEGAVEGDVLGTRPQAGTSVRQGANITVVSTIE